MAYLTRAQAQGYQRGFDESFASVAAKQASATASNKATAEKTIFLSHSHRDRDLVEPAIAFLRSHGVKIYVDWLDEGMPDSISGETAKRIKNKIAENQKFLLLLTENSKDSRWVPWELGFADPVKGMKNMAILPIAENTDFSQNEYMKIYPKIQMINGLWWFWPEDVSSLKVLNEWLRS